MHLKMVPQSPSVRSSSVLAVLATSHKFAGKAKKILYNWLCILENKTIFLEWWYLASPPAPQWVFAVFQQCSKLILSKLYLASFE